MKGYVLIYFSAFRRFLFNQTFDSIPLGIVYGCSAVYLLFCTLLHLLIPSYISKPMHQEFKSRPSEDALTMSHVTLNTHNAHEEARGKLPSFVLIG